MKIPAAIFLCNTGAMYRPWAEAGFECYCVDIRNSIRDEHVTGKVHQVWGDVRSWCLPENIQVIFLAGFPPCTNLAGSGARDWATKGNYFLSDALQLWSSCYQLGTWSGAPFMIENPVGAISRHMRPPDFSFDPCDYAGYLLPEKQLNEAYTKRTCLWTGNGFIMPERKRIDPILGSKMHRLPPSKHRDLLRSQIPEGFSQAVFEANAF